MCEVLLTIIAQGRFIAGVRSQVHGQVRSWVHSQVHGQVHDHVLKLASKSCAFKKEIIIGAAKPILKPVAYDRAWQSVLGIFLHLLILQREESISSGAGLSVTPKPEMEKIFSSQLVSFLEV